MPEQPAIESLNQGDRLHGTYRLKQLVHRQTAQGKPFLLGELQDRSGTIGFVWWQVDEGVHGRLQQTGYAKVQAKVDRHRERLQAVIQRMDAVAADTIDPADFTPVSDIDVEATWQELCNLIASLDDEPVRRLLVACFIEDEAFAARFREAPAAITMHHACRHGLLAHSVAVARLAEDCCQRYARIDRDLLIAGALLHDACKVDELQWEDSPRYTAVGNLVGHVSLGAQRIARLAEGIPDFPERTLWKLQHLVLSHHGELEHGAAKLPVTLEAVVLHLIDNLDSRIAGFTETVDTSTSADPDWTEVSRLFGRRLYRGP